MELEMPLKILIVALNAYSLGFVVPRPLRLLVTASESLVSADFDGLLPPASRGPVTLPRLKSGNNSQIRGTFLNDAQMTKKRKPGAHHDHLQKKRNDSVDMLRFSKPLTHYIHPTVTKEQGALGVKRNEPTRGKFLLSDVSVLEERDNENLALDGKGGEQRAVLHCGRSHCRCAYLPGGRKLAVSVLCEQTMRGASGTANYGLNLHAEAILPHSASPAQELSGQRPSSRAGGSLQVNEPTILRNTLNLSQQHIFVSAYQSAV
ncbi:hypothetical protein P7K49_008310 [Saguinus oedipus]|uniref:Uncharacterized protein n=1 Tax=Saguinus oedipus TaxID=9490 RepID=A0ABQ9VXC1_SAGOE|nr:hypothetical protein P7K49_008310 [Saguinus oedipus]